MSASSEPSPPRHGSASILVRRSRPHDQPYVAALAEKVFSIYGSYDRYLADWFETENVTTLIAELDGRPAGVAMLVAYPHRIKRAEAVADLLAIAVEPAEQGKGVGTALLERVIEEAPRLPAPWPIRELHLSVADGNARARRLFSSFGFRMTRDEGIYPAGQRALHMIKVVEPAGASGEDR